MNIVHECSVELIDYMGDDLRVADAARVSFDKKSSLNADGTLQDRDAKLINYLARHKHWTPFSHCMITLRETVPIFVSRQRFKHMVGFTYNEVSRRYVDDEPSFFVPTEWRGRAENKKQGSNGFLDEEMEPVVSGDVKQLLFQSVEVYNFMLTVGTAPEQARMVLPQNMMTSYYVTGSLAAWARAYNLRAAEDSQKEIQDLAAKWNEIIAPLFPVSWKALTEEK